MKKLLFALLATATMQSQNVYFSTGLDLKNAITGSEATNNKPSYNGIYTFGMVDSKGFEVSITYEQFKRLDFNRFSFGVGKSIALAKDIDLIPTLEPTLINRSDDWGGGLGYKDNPSSHLTLGVSLPIRYDLNDNFAVELYSNYMYRTDIATKYGTDGNRFSFFGKLIYKINL